MQKDISVPMENFAYSKMEHPFKWIFLKHWNWKFLYFNIKICRRPDRTSKRAASGQRAVVCPSLVYTIYPRCVIGYTVLSRFVYVHSVTFTQRRNRLTMHFSERIPVVKRRISVYGPSSSQIYRPRAYSFPSLWTLENTLADKRLQHSPTWSELSPTG